MFQSALPFTLPYSAIIGMGPRNSSIRSVNRCFLKKLDYIIKYIIIYYKNGTGSKHGSWPLDYALLVTWQEGKHPGVLGSTYKIASSHIKGRKNQDIPVKTYFKPEQRYEGKEQHGGSGKYFLPEIKVSPRCDSY